MKRYRIFLAAIVGVLVAGCYNDFDTPAPQKIYTDADAEQWGARKVTIAEVKRMFMDEFHTLSGTGTNDDDNWKTTKYLRIEEDCYLKAKVISNDEQGNIYKSLFLWDGTAAIELKLTNGNYLKYHLNLAALESQYVYVKLKGLYIGNYRMMLSLGNGPTDSFNAVGDHKLYANSNIEDPFQIAARVFPGERCALKLGEDIKVVDKDSYRDLGEADFGRLVRFEGVKCLYAGVENQYGETPPELRNGSYSQIYPSWICTDVRPVVNRAWYKWAYSVGGTCLYASVRFGYNENAVYTSEKGVYQVRTSGYARFANRNVTRDGAVGTITGIFSIYSKRSDYSGDSGDYANYQVSVSRFEDLEFAAEDFLTDEEVERLTPAESYDPPVKDRENEQE